MVSLLVKILLVLMVIMAADIAVQEATGGITVRGDTYRLTDLIILLFEGLATFLAVNVHAITHVLDIDSVIQDMSFNVQGVMAFIMWTVGAVFDLTLHFIKLPFEFIGDVVPAFGFYLGIEELAGIMVDFQTLTISFTIGNIDNKDIFGIRFELENRLTFTVFGVPEDLKVKVYKIDLQNLDELGDIYYYEFEETSDKLQGFLGFEVFMDDRVWTKPAGVYQQFPPFISFPIVLDESLETIFELILDSMRIPSPRKWIQDVWREYGIEIYEE